MSQLSHLGSIIEYQYGFKNSVCCDRGNEEYMIIIDDSHWELSNTWDVDTYSFQKQELLEMNVNFEAHNLAKSIWITIPEI